MKWAQDEFTQFKDTRSEGAIFARRVFTAMIFVLVIFGVLVYRYYTLQVVYHKDYLTLSDQNRIQVRPKPPNRGLILDRKGKILAENRPSFTLSLVKERADDIEQVIEKVAELINVSGPDRENFYEALKQRRRPYQAVPLRYRLSQEEMALIAVNKYSLPAVQVDAQLVRHYPYGELFAHSVGYVGRINDKEIQEFTEQDFARYAGTHVIGKVGIEKYYESELLGQVGTEFIEANAHGRVLRVVREDSPVAGSDLRLHMDLALQHAATEGMNGRRGAVVAIDVRTGGVLASVSTPSYDPNLFVTGISFKDFKLLNESPDLPLFNRTIQGQYPPGSTLKPMLGLGGLQEQIVNFDTVIDDPGYYQLPNDERLYREWKKGGHGLNVDLEKAIVESCDVYFYDMAYRMGVDRMHAFGDQFGLGKKNEIDVPNERPGLWPSREWKKRARGVPWFPGNSLNMSIGQGDVLSTPLQLAVMTGALATRGQRYKPRLVASINGQAIAPTLVQQIEVYDEYWDYVLKSMEGVVHGRMGTARIISKKANYRMAGKTGTAQVVGIAQDEEYDRDKVGERNRDHGLFIGYAPAEAPEIAVAVIVENGEHGSTAAAPVARAVFDAYFESQKVVSNNINTLSKRKNNE